MDISLMFFGADDVGAGSHLGKFDEIMRIARVADSLGFAAIWTPERHFQQVGQVFPSPPVLSAALAAVTERIAVRAGSVVLPLHHPLRVVEDWSVVDNLSRGRVGISVATGWHSTDFVLAPDRFQGRRERALEQIPLLRRLWAGDEVEFVDGAGRTVAVRPAPRPCSDRLPLWLTTSGSPRTWEAAGRLRTNILGAASGQTREELADRIRLYREAYQAAPAQLGAIDQGTVTLMAHCYVGADRTDAVRRAGGPLRRYLRSYVSQTAANHDGGPTAELTDEQTERLTSFAVRRHLAWGSMIGSPEDCGATLRDLRELGCDEVACLIDFGLGADDVLAGLYRLDELRKDLEA